MFLDVEEEVSATKKKAPVYDRPRNMNSKDEVWKHLWKIFIRQFLGSELLQKVKKINIFQFFFLFLFNSFFSMGKNKNGVKKR